MIELFILAAIPVAAYAKPTRRNSRVFCSLVGAIALSALYTPFTSPVLNFFILYAALWLHDWSTS